MSLLQQALTHYLTEAEARAPARGAEAVMASCDLAFARRLVGQAAFPNPDAFARHLALLRSVQMAGTSPSGSARLSVHLTAYALASLNLAREDYRDAAAAFVGDQTWDWRRLVDSATLLPLWPRRYAHHAWRIGHWVGGAPAILRLLWILSPEVCAAQAIPSAKQVLEACDRLIEPATGLLRTWRSSLLQSTFRRVYRLRHDPAAGDIGGVAHLHWINHAEGRLPYKSAAALQERAWRLMQRRPFIEASPYCLDFDVVQMVRTSAVGPLGPEVRQRAQDYAVDIADFLAGARPDYSLHRLPGALATLHECALIRGDAEVCGLDIPPCDIITSAGWL